MEDIFNKKTYQEIKAMLNDLYLELFRYMLDYKKVSYLKEENNFEYLDSLVRINYPQFSQSLIHISVLINEPNDNTYLDIIKELLATYINLKDMYMDFEFEKKYLESNPNSGEDVIL